MMQSNYRAELFPRIAGKQRLQRPLRAVAGILARDFLHHAYKFRIKRQACLSERHKWNHRRAFRCGRKNPCSRPGCFLSGFLPVEQSDAQAGSRKFKCDRSTDQSAASNGNIKLFHVASLPHPAIAFMQGERTLGMCVLRSSDKDLRETSDGHIACGQVPKLRKTIPILPILPTRSAPSWPAREPAPNLLLGQLLVHQK